MYSVSSGSEAISRNMDNLLFSSNFKYSSIHPDFSKPKPTFHHHSDTYNNNNNYYNVYNQTQEQQQQQQQQSSSLARYRSAPSSFFASLLNEDDEDNEDHRREAAVEEVMMFPEMMNMKQEAGVVVEDEEQQQEEDFGAAAAGGVVSSAGMVFGAHATTTTTTKVTSVAPVVVSETSFRGMEVFNKSGGVGLLRKSSSPAGFLSNLVDEIGFGSTSNIGSFRANNRTNMSFSSGKSSHSRFMPQITENGNANVEMSSQQNGQLGSGQNGDHSNRHYLPTIPNNSSFNGLKRSRDGEMKMSTNLSGLDTQNGGSKHYNSGLLHQLSLPSTSAEMESIENLLQFQQDNVVACKIRAKRGFATHPRSIAERVRRTRISERMKKLQELFPNMDKQANTADMLDLAVEFIKDLQKEVQTLNETRARCTCSSKIKQSSPA